MFPARNDYGRKNQTQRTTETHVKNSRTPPP
jgi:hypothetical protein